jgi:hypothetical protein
LWRASTPRWRRSSPPGFIRPCEPTLVNHPPAGPGWLHEVKHDGFRILAWKQGERVEVWSRRGADFTDRFARIADAVRGLSADEALIDGEGVIFLDDGHSDFHALLTKRGWSHLRHAFELADAAIRLLTMAHASFVLCGVLVMIAAQALVEGQQVEFVVALFRSIWGAEPGRLHLLNRPSFFGEILCCWRPRWIAGSEGSPMHAYAWSVWRKRPRSGPSLKVRIGRDELIAVHGEAAG